MHIEEIRQHPCLSFMSESQTQTKSEGHHHPGTFVNQFRKRERERESVCGGGESGRKKG